MSKSRRDVSISRKNRRPNVKQSADLRRAETTRLDSGEVIIVFRNAGEGPEDGLNIVVTQAMFESLKSEGGFNESDDDEDDDVELDGEGDKSPEPGLVALRKKLREFWG